MKKWIIIIIAAIAVYGLLSKEEMCARCRYAGVVNCTECNGIGMKFPNGYSAPSKMCNKCNGTCLEKCPECNGDGRTSMLDMIF